MSSHDGQETEAPHVVEAMEDVDAMEGLFHVDIDAIADEDCMGDENETSANDSDDLSASTSGRNARSNHVAPKKTVKKVCLVYLLPWREDAEQT